jgi:FkbM family methyltransferase
VASPSSASPTGVWRAAAAVKRRLQFVSRYASQIDWLKSYYDAMVRAQPSWPWPAAGRVVKARIRALPAPLHLRLGSTDWFVAEEVFLRDVYAVVRTVAPSDTRVIVDLGANVGLTLALWHAWWPEAHMVAVEPDDDNLRVLALNVGGFADRVRTVRACAVGVAREIELDRHASEDAYRISEIGHGAGPRLPGRTMGEILKAHGIGGVDLLKCDIEGAEREVFAACDDWIGRVRSMVVEVHEGFGVSELADLLGRAGGRFESVDAGDPTIAVFRRTE